MGGIKGKECHFMLSQFTSKNDKHACSVVLSKHCPASNLTCHNMNKITVRCGLECVPVCLKCLGNISCLEISFDKVRGAKMKPFTLIDKIILKCNGQTVNGE